MLKNSFFLLFYYAQCTLIDMLFIFNIQYFHFLVATQGLLREGEDHLFHRVEPPQENFPIPFQGPADSYPPLEVLPMATPPPREGRRKCYPACKGGAGFCQGRCVLRDGLRAGEMFQEPLLLISDVTIYTQFLKIPK